MIFRDGLIIILTILLICINRCFNIHLRYYSLSLTKLRLICRYLESLDSFKLYALTFTMNINVMVEEATFKYSKLILSLFALLHPFFPIEITIKLLAHSFSFTPASWQIPGLPLSGPAWCSVHSPGNCGYNKTFNLC